MPSSILDQRHDVDVDARDRVAHQLGPAGQRGSDEFDAYYRELAAWPEWAEWAPVPAAVEPRPDWRQAQ